jgi:hypothetical protein
MSRPCPDCGVQPGSLHESGCDVEPCPRCGGQMISCRCIYEVCGMDYENLEQLYPNIYNHGATPAMQERWEREWGHRRMPWTGTWPGVVECHEYGLWCKMVDGRGWVPCGQDEQGASEDLNQLIKVCYWDRDAQRWVLKPNLTRNMR